MNARPTAPPRAHAVTSTPERLARRVNHGEHVSQALKDQICEMALGILEEQVQARIVHYRADLQTNPELDAITDEVVASIRELQALSTPSPGSATQAATRASQIKNLSGLLQRAFRARGPSIFVEKRLKEIHKKLAKLFFQSELHEKTRGTEGSVRVIQHGEQAVYYLLARYKHRLQHELGGFDYASAEIKDRACALLAHFNKDMQDAFLSKRSAELKRMVRVFQTVLLDFFCNNLAPAATQIAEDVVTQSASFEGRSSAHRIAPEVFPPFRVAMERQLMVRLVSFAEDLLIAKLADTAGSARDDVVSFVTDPRIFSMIVGEISEGLYESLCDDGFLELPSDWRHATVAPA